MANEEKNEAPAPEATAEEQANKSNKRKFIIIGGIGVAVLLLIGGGLFWFLSSGKKADVPEGVPAGSSSEVAEGEEAPGAASEGEAQAEGAAAESQGAANTQGSNTQGSNTQGGNSQPTGDLVDFGCTYGFKPFNLNLGNPLENRYVRLEIAVEFGCNQEMQAEIEKRLPQLRDAIISVTSQKTREFLLSSDGKDQLRREIHNRLNHYMTKKINDVFITDILIE